MAERRGLPRLVALGLAALALAACAGSRAGPGGGRDLSQFSCDERRAEYMVAGGFVAAEAGVTVECGGDDPQLTKWRMDERGERQSSTHALTGEQFDVLWERIDSTGWRYLDDTCPGAAAAAPDDPLYTIVVADHAISRTYSCAGRTLPFPYDRLVNELDLRAAGLGDADDPNL